jgi:hypothetical protein
MSLAPIDSQKQVPLGTNFGVLLPACDGDVSTLAGANAFERSKYSRPNDPFARVQFYVQGANHNYFNTVWTGDDGAGYSGTGSNADVACGEDKPSSIRLYPSDQRKVGIALMASFLRRYLGMEAGFDPYMTGAAPLPRSACPALRGVACDEVSKTSYIAPAAARQDVIRPEADHPLALDAAGGPLTGTGFSTYDWCNEDRDQSTGTQIKPCPTVGGSVNRSFGRQLTLAWDGPATLRAELRGDARRASRFGTLALRAAVNHFDARNPVSDGTNPGSATQDFDVALIDRAGKSASVRASDYGTALEPSIGSFRRHIVLNGLRIPLTAFAEVDLSDLEAVELRFGAAEADGSIQLADVSFQEPAAAPTAAAERRAVTPLSGPKRVDGIAVGGVTTVPSASRCADVAAPVATLATVRLAGKRLRVAGSAADAGCAAASGKTARRGGVRRVQVSVRRAAAGGCRYLTARGRLSAVLPCDAPLSVIARGKRSWRLTARARLPRGVYRVTAQAVDRAGNVSTVRSRALRVG